MSMIVDNSEILNLQDQVSTSGVVVNLSDINILSLSSTYSVLDQDPATADSATDITGDVFTVPDHGLVTGVVGQMTTDDTLPTPLLVLTDYYIIRLDDDTFSLAISLNNALAEIAITLSDTGTGNQTFTPTAASGSIDLLESVDGQTFVAVSGMATTITSAGTTLWHVSPIVSRYYKVLFTADTGVISVVTTINARNNTCISNAYVVPVSAVNS